MKMSTYIAVIVFGLLFTVFANADAPNYRYPQPVPQSCPGCLPVPLDNCPPPDQVVYCQPGRRCAAPVLPYPGPQQRVVVLPRQYSAVCSVEQAGHGMYVIVVNGVQVIYGPAVGPNIQANLLHYQRIGVCQPF